MNIILPGDKDYESRPSVQRKSLRINLNENIYGTFVQNWFAYELLMAC